MSVDFHVKKMDLFAEAYNLTKKSANGQVDYKTINL